MKSLISSLGLLLFLAGAGMATPVSHYDMGSAGRFSPVAGGESDIIGFSNGLWIDTRSGEIEIPSDAGPLAQLRVEALRPTSTHRDGLYHIIQFSGPVNRDWLRELELLGVEPFGYLPNYAVLAKLDLDRKVDVTACPFVKWVGLFEPAFKVSRALMDEAGIQPVVTLLMPNERPDGLVALIGELGGSVSQVQSSEFGTTVYALVDLPAIVQIAGQNEVLWIQEDGEPETANDDCQWVVQTGWRASAPAPTDTLARHVWTRGVRGQGVVLSTTDTGLNIGHDMFRDPAMSVTAPGIWPAHRKVIAYKKYATADASEGQYHGSHVNCTVAGDDSVTGGTSFYDGMAPKGRLYFVDLTNGGSFVLTEDLWTLWDTTYFGRGLPDSLRPIKQHSGSWRWGNRDGTYLLQDASTDAFGWAHKDFLNLIAAGNEYSTRRIGNPSIAKNVVTVGATENGTSANVIADFSSRGPTQDNRIKPTVCAPGVDLWSATKTGTNTYAEMSGTSMATPATNGAMGLLRCYLREGYYPTGSAEPGNRIDYISAALLRSMVIASADPNIGSFVVPSFDIGWGRVDIDSVLHFQGDARKLIVKDDTTGLSTGEFKELQFRVNSRIPLRVALVWTDTAASPNANPTLVNDLNLEVIAPNGTEYRGNKYSGGQSTPNPTSWDAINVEECARVNSPDTGTWRIWVGAQNVATRTKQPFAWTITGDVELTSLRHDVGVSAIIEPAGRVDSGSVVVPKAIVGNYGTGSETFEVAFSIGTSYADTQSILLLPGQSDTASFQAWTAELVGWHEAICRALLPGDENPANDMLADSFQVIPPQGLEEAGDVPRAFALEPARPSPFAGRTAVNYALPRSTRAVLRVYSTTGELVRTLEPAGRAGWHQAVWDGTNDAGHRVGRGIYYLRFRAGEFKATQKLVKLD